MSFLNPQSLENVECFSILEETSNNNNNDGKIRKRGIFGESDAIIRRKNDEIHVRPHVSTVKSTILRSKPFEENSFVREDLIVLTRLRDLKDRTLRLQQQNSREKSENPSKTASPGRATKDTSKRSLPHPIIVQAMRENMPRYTPPAETLLGSQARMIMKEISAITALHIGCEEVASNVINTVADVGIEFLLNLGKVFSQERDRVMERWTPASCGYSGFEPFLFQEISCRTVSNTNSKLKGKSLEKVNSQKGKTSIHKKLASKVGCKQIKTVASGHRVGKFAEHSLEIVHNSLIALTHTFNRIGCGIDGLENFIIEGTKFGDQLREADRKVIRKGGKTGKSAAEKTVLAEQNAELDQSFKESVFSIKLGLAFMKDTFQSTGKILPPRKSPKPIMKKRKREDLTNSEKVTKKKNSKPLNKNKDSKKSPEKPLAFADVDLNFEQLTEIDAGMVMKIEDLDMALSAKKSTKSNEKDVSSAIDTNVGEFEAELDLSNLDDFFDGDMLGDDMLPTSF